MDSTAFTVGIHNRIDEIEAEWDALADRVGAPPWHRPLWYRAWWESFARGALELIAVRDGGRLVGLAPTERVGKEIRSAANSETPDFRLLAENETIADRLATHMFASGHRVNLFPLALDGAGASAVYRALSAAGYSMMDRSLGGAPYIDVGEWDSYVAGLDTKMLREIRRRHRRLNEISPVTLEISTQQKQLEEFFELEMRGWKGGTGTAIASRPKVEAFYRRLAELAIDRGWMLIASLRQGDRVIASDICLEVDGHHYLLKTSFDPEHARFGPGQLLRYLMLRRVFGSGMSTYDFLGKDDRWKKDWTKEARPLTQLRAFPHSARGTSERAFFQIARSVKDLIERDK